MKAVLQNMKTGALLVDDVPSPALQDSGVLVRVHRSLISLGTEKAIIALANKGPLGMAKDRPDLAKKVMNKAKQEGYWNTYQVVRNLISSPIPLGYSCAGEVVEVGARAREFQVGDRVACAGLNFANHAEFNYVPRNLAVKIPDELSYEDASFATVGAIALQGIRLAEIEIGETVVVLGLGIVGQLVAQLARCAGATVIGADLDPTKVALAEQLGAHHVVKNADELASMVASRTGGQGADAVLICAATKSHDPIRDAASLSRLKGKVVVVGDVGMHIERRAYYEKELKIIVSRSYGPGRHDRDYEIHGTDYPFAYVRWTENRNMTAFLDLVSRNEVQVQPLVTHQFPIDQAHDAYEIVTGKRNENAVAILLQYSGESVIASRQTLTADAAQPPQVQGVIRLGVIGAGQYAKGILLPAFARTKSVRFDAFCTSSGLTSKHVAKRYGARYCTSDPDDVIQDDKIDAVIIATRHDQHAALAARALRAGKAVFLEKPLALTQDSLLDLCQTASEVGSPRLMVGFNRRFSRLSQQCLKFFHDRHEPLFLMYRVNAGSVPEDSWVTDPIVGGGRILGEVCHFVDMLCYMTGALPKRIFAEQLVNPGEAANRDSVSITLRMSDESIGTIHYLGNGDPSLSKEYLELFGAQRSAILDNFCSLSLHRGNRRRRTRLFNQAKGQVEEAAAFADALLHGKPMPIDFETLVAVTQTTLLIHQSLDTGVPVDYSPPQAEIPPA